MTPTPAVSAKEKVRDSVLSAMADVQTALAVEREQARITRHLLDTLVVNLRAGKAPVEEIRKAWISEDWIRELCERISLDPTALSTEGEAEPVACGVYPPPETYGGSPNDEWTGRPPSAPAGVKDDAREFVAKVVYSAMKWAAERAEKGTPPEWVERGNSLAQSEARRVARNITDYVTASLQPDTQAAAASPTGLANWLPLDDDGAAELRVNGKRITSFPSYPSAEEAAERINAALSPAPSSAAGVKALMSAVRRAEDGAGTLPAKESVKLRPGDWAKVCRLARALSAPAQEGR